MKKIVKEPIRMKHATTAGYSHVDCSLHGYIVYIVHMYKYMYISRYSCHSDSPHTNHCGQSDGIDGGRGLSASPTFQEEEEARKRKRCSCCVSGLGSVLPGVQSSTINALIISIALHQHEFNTTPMVL